MKNLWNVFVEEESGQGLVEYALILVLVSLAVVAALRLVGTKINDKFTNINDELGK